MSTSKNFAEQKGPPAPLAAFTVLQRVLPVRIGLSAEEIKARREKHLEENVHWAYKGNAIYFSEEGVAALTRSACVTPEKTAPAAASEETRDGAAAAREALAFLTEPQPLRVWRAFPHIRNKHIVEVYIDGTHPEDRENIERLWVKDNTFFRQGMLIAPTDYETRPGEKGQYNYTGRQPRRRQR